MLSLGLIAWAVLALWAAYSLLCIVIPLKPFKARGSAAKSLAGTLVAWVGVTLFVATADFSPVPSAQLAAPEATEEDRSQEATEERRVFVEDESRPATPTNAWQVRSKTSALDDSTSVFLSVSSEDPVRDRFGRGSPARLTVRCLENTTSVTINFAGLFMSNTQGGGRVDFRVDDNPAGNVRMAVSNNNQALGLWRGGQSIPFIQKHLLNGDSLYLRATPFNESPVEMHFNISGLDDVIDPLREACNW